jgi:hypothetical protein
MCQKLRSRLTFANVVSVIALFVSLGGVGAYAANTIGSSDVIDDSLLSQDIKGKSGTSTTAAENGTLTGVDISGQAARPSVGQPFVDGSLTGDDVKNKSLTGTDISDATLATLTKASATNSFCNPESTSFVDCGTVTINLTRTSRVLIVANGMWYSVSGGATRGVCRIGVDGAPLGSSVFPGQLLSNSNNVHEQGFALTNVTSPLAPGSHNFGLACNQEEGNIDLDETFVSVAVLGSG